MDADMVGLLGSPSSKLKLPSERFWRTINGINQIRSRKRRGMTARHTLLALMRVAQLLESTADLLWSPMFAGLFEDVFGDEAVPVGESAERFGGPGVGGLIAGETLGEKGKMRVDIMRG